ncbi:MAG: NAD(P)-binding protein [Desulfatitalea sp.]|nr:FAD-dependent oxidoreductase [Desulfatitalea sp.]NNK00172.1 NAD(P)-binding protein [Desulfatitalea sp.]
MSTYDVAVVGGGLGGLSAGALLAKAGKKVLVLEKGTEVGGFARSFTPAPGYTIDYGAHGLFLGHKNAIADVYGRIGKKMPPLRSDSPSDVHGENPFSQSWTFHDGEFKSLASLLKPEEMKKVFGMIAKVPKEEISQLCNVRLEDYIAGLTTDSGVRHFFKIIGGGFGLIARGAECSAGYIIGWVQGTLKITGKPIAIDGVTGGGIKILLMPLVETIKENGGEIRTETLVSEIIVEDGKVKGVEIDKGPRVEMGYVSMGVEKIECPSVVCAVPVWDLFRVIRESVLPYWYVAWVKNACRNLTQVYTINAGLKEPLWEPAVRGYSLLTLPRLASTHGTCFIGHPPGMSPNGEYLFSAMIQDDELDSPYFTEIDKAENRRRVIDVFDKMEADIADLWPKYKDPFNTRWAKRTASVLGISEQPGYAHPQRLIDVQPPCVKGLYLVGEQLRSVEGQDSLIGAVATTALKAADLIMQEGAWRQVPNCQVSL